MSGIAAIRAQVSALGRLKAISYAIERGRTDNRDFGPPLRRFGRVCAQGRRHGLPGAQSDRIAIAILRFVDTGTGYSGRMALDSTAGLKGGVLTLPDMCDRRSPTNLHERRSQQSLPTFPS